jgi:outer membrane protein assembly factor BamE (lipoprotein component of BamABCDE complex)
MQSTRVNPSLLVPALVVGCAWASLSYADPNTEETAKRISKLEASVSSLEAKVAALEAALAQDHSDSGNIPSRPDKAKWRSLSKGMTKKQVRNILGEPARIEALGSFEYWRYPPMVTFHDDRLYGWEEP